MSRLTILAIALMTIGPVALGQTTSPVEVPTKTPVRPDLEIELPIQAGDAVFTQYRAATPNFELAGARLDPDSTKTRLMVGVRFTTRRVKSAHIEVRLLDGAGGERVLYTASHDETRGPDRVVAKGHNLDKVREWNAFRALWFDFPEDAREAKALRVTVRLKYDDPSAQP